MNKRVVITGLGCVTPAGTELHTVWQAAIAGKSLAQPVIRFNTSGLRSKLAGQVPDIDYTTVIPPMALRRLDPLTRMVIFAGHLALKDAAVDPPTIPPERLGIVMGTGYGSTSHTDEFFRGVVAGADSLNPSLFPNTVPNASASSLAIHLKFKGPNSTFTQKEVSGEAALAFAADLISNGRADLVLAGSGEELSEFMFHSLHQVRALSPRPNHNEEVMRPYDLRRNGWVVGEGCAIVVLEDLERARTRGARIYAEIAATACRSGSDGPVAYDATGRSSVAAMHEALALAKIPPDDVAFVHGSANGSTVLDRMEAEAVAEVFAGRSEPMPLISTRSLFGALEGYGVIKLALSCLALQYAAIPPTPELELPMKVPGIRLVNHSPAPLTGSAILLHSASYGGVAMALAIKQIDHEKPSGE